MVHKPAAWVWGDCPTQATQSRISRGDMTCQSVAGLTDTHDAWALPGYTSADEMPVIWIQNWMWLDSKLIALQSSQSLLRPVLGSHFPVPLRSKWWLGGSHPSPQPWAPPLPDPLPSWFRLCRQCKHAQLFGPGRTLRRISTV